MSSRVNRSYTIVFLVFILFVSLACLEYSYAFESNWTTWWRSRSRPHHSSETIYPPKVWEAPNKNPVDQTAISNQIDNSELAHQAPNPLRPDQIVLLTASDGKGHSELIQQALDNRQAYCDYHGYICQYVDISQYDLKGAHPSYGKVPAIQDAFATHPDAQWVWWLDLDAIIMSASVSLIDSLLSPEIMIETLQFGVELKQHPYGFESDEKVYMAEREDVNADQIDLLIAQDLNSINAGSFLIRRSEWTRQLLELWIDPLLRCPPTSLWNEQFTLIHLIGLHSAIRSHVGIIPLRTINSNSWGEWDMAWRNGDLVVHFAGCNSEWNCDERWNSFWEMKEEVPKMQKTE